MVLSLGGDMKAGGGRRDLLIFQLASYPFKHNKTRPSYVPIPDSGLHPTTPSPYFGKWVQSPVAFSNPRISLLYSFTGASTNQEFVPLAEG